MHTKQKNIFINIYKYGNYIKKNKKNLKKLLTFDVV